MSAGTAQITLYGHFMADRKRSFPFYQVTGIGSKRGHAGMGMTDGAVPIRMGQASCLLLQPLPV